MLSIFKSFGGFVEIPTVQKNCWVNVTAPGTEEIKRLHEEFNMPEDIIRDIMDADERPRLEFDDDWTLFIIRIPISNTQNGVPFSTVPLGIFLSPEFTITLCSVVNDVLPHREPALYNRSVRQPHDVLNFILKLFMRSTSYYLNYLKQINQQTNRIEQDLEQSIHNRELDKLLKMEKCLVFFITSLKANELVLVRLRNAKKNTLDEINEELLEDVIIENKQALDMAQIYSDIQSGMMDAFASVISNNLNVVMKQLTSISIILMIPTLIASIYGMNIPNHLEGAKWAFPAVIGVSALMAFGGVIMFRRKKWF